MNYIRLQNQKHFRLPIKLKLGTSSYLNLFNSPGKTVSSWSWRGNFGKVISVINLFLYLFCLMLRTPLSGIVEYIHTGVLCVWIITEVKKNVRSALERFRANNCDTAFFLIVVTFKCSQYKHAELTNIINEACFQSHIHTCSLNKIILLNSFIVEGNKWSYILKGTVMQVM